MTLDNYIDEILLSLTGGVLELEISRDTIAKVLNKALRELQRYIDSTKIATIPYSPCIDLKDANISSISRVYRAESYLASDKQGSVMDPMFLAQWQMLSNNNGTFNINDWAYNLASWNTSLQIRNTLSTDLAFRYDKSSEKLYINTAFDRPNLITIEFIPKLMAVEDITSDYWIDILIRLSTAMTKVILGRIRTFATQNNALWQLDGPTMLEEGNKELSELREILRTQSQLTFPID